MNTSSGKKSMGFSIKGRLILFTLSISLIPIAIISLTHYIHSRNNLKIQAQYNLTAVAESEKNHVISFLKEKKIRTIDFSSDGFVREKLETITYGIKYKAIEDLNKHLSVNKKPLDPSIAEIAILDTDGRVVASTNKMLIGLDMSRQKAFTQAINKGHGETFTGQPRYSPEFDATGIFVSAPIVTSNGTGEVTGVIINVYDSGMLIDITNTAEKEVRTVDFSFDVFIRDSLDIINRGNTLTKKEAAIVLSEHLLKNKKPLDPHIMLIEVVNRHGKVVASTDETTIGRDISSQDAFAKVMDKIYNKPYIMQPYFTPLLNTKGLDVCAPITYMGQVIGILINHYDLSVLSEITTEHTGRGGSRETLLGMKSGDNIVFLTPLRYVHDSPLGLSIPMDAPEAEPMQLALTAEAGTVIAPDYRGVDVVAAYRHIPMVDWGLVVKVDKDEVFAPLRMLGILALIAGFISAVVVVGVSVVFAISISRPIRKLTYATERLAGGDLEHGIKIPLNDEIGVLAGSFETMRIRLGKYLNKIEKDKKEWVSTFDSVRDIIILWDKECRLIRCNKALLEGLNIKSEDIIGKNCQEIFHQIKDEDLDKCAVIETTKTLKPVTREIEVPCLGGIFSVSIFSRFDDNGEFIGSVQIMRDITEWKKAGDKLRRSESNLKDAQKIAHTGNWCWDIVKNELLWSDEIYRIFGLKPQEFDATYESFLSFVHPDDREFVKKSVKEALYENKPYDIDHRIILPDGSVRTVNEQAEVVFDQTGKAIQMNGIVQDITERKLIEEGLRTRERQQAAISEFSLHVMEDPGIDTLLNEAVSKVALTLKVEFCKILELLPDGKALLLKAGVGWKEGIVGHATVGAGNNSQAGYTLFSNKPVVVKDFRTDTRFSAPPLLKEHGVISGVSVIIRGKKRPFGVLGVHTNRHRTFNKNDIYFIQAIANVLAEAIERKNIEIQFRSIVDNSTDGIITINEQGIIQLYNPAAESLFGYTSAEVISQNVKMLMPEPYHSEHDNYLQRYISTGKGHIIGIGPREVRGLHSDGTTFPMELAIGEMHIGEQRMFVGVLHDITDRKKAEEAIRKMAAIVEYSDDAIISQTTDGIITSWNPGSEQIYGYTSDEMIGKNMSILAPSNRVGEIRSILERITRGKRIEHFETIRITKDGNEINVSLTISPIKDRDDKIIGVASIARDITRTKELEEKLRISYKMSSLGRLTAGVFHEVLNPLHIISSYAQLLLSQGKWTSKTEGDLKKILEEVGRIVKITDGLLRFARRKEPKVEEVEINSLLKKVIDIVEPEMKLENIELLKKFDKRLPKIMANSDELRQVFLNLIHNAEHAMSGGGKLTISTQGIKKQERLFARVSFADTGHGIPKEQIDKVFDPFFTTKEEGKGTGLGLSISYGIIKDHKGELSVNSKEGKGATFTIDLPVKDL